MRVVSRSSKIVYLNLILYLKKVENTQNLDLVFVVFAILILLGGLFMLFQGSSGIDR
jgi:uncharacterized membrane protein